MENEPSAQQSDLPRIVPMFQSYKPSFDTGRAVRRMLDTVPRHYLRGLHTIVLTSTGNFSRQRRRRNVSSRKQTFREAEARGRYNPATPRDNASIEIFFDQVFAGWDSALLLKVPLVQDILLAPVLFHEIGHHIHSRSAPELRDREEVANEWQAKLEATYFRRPPLVRIMTLIARPFRKLVRRLVSSS